MKRRAIAWVAATAVIIVMIGTGLILGTEPGHYVFCLMNEGRWERSETQAELEATLWFYTSRQIAPSESSWGHQYVLRDGERMMQYLILKDPTCPLDIVYDRNGKVTARFTSYE